MIQTGLRKVASGLATAVTLILGPLTSPAQAQSEFLVTGFGGILTDNVWEETLMFWDADYLNSGFVGLAFGHDVFRRGRVSFGYEGQIVQHFGDQDNYEINVPLVVRYHRQGRFLPALESMAFGLGLSWASERPATEVRRHGDSTNFLIYWMGELQVDLPGTELQGIARIHHRSSGYGHFPVEAGSNGLALGVRHRF